MSRNVDVLIVGGGQSGLAMSHLLTQQDIEHVILERHEAANSWRRERWDSFHLVLPNRLWRMPGMAYDGDRPDGFMSKNEVVDRFDRYVAQARPPLIGNTVVRGVSLDRDDCFRVASEGQEFRCRQLVVATGPFQRPNIPSWAGEIDPAVTQLASQDYRHPGQLPDGAVVVVGTGQSGVQIAEELLASGRKVYVCLGTRGWIPRRYLGRDICDWYEEMGIFDVTLDKFPSLKEARAGGFSQLAGDGGAGHDLNLHTLHSQGATLLGRLVAGDRNGMQLRDGAACMEAADAFARKACDMVKAFADATKHAASTDDPWPEYCGTTVDGRQRLDFRRDGIASIVWANGFRPAYDWLGLPVCNDAGHPVHQRGVTGVPGLYFLGLEWQLRRKSSTLMAGAEDAAHLLAQIMRFRGGRRSSGPTLQEN